MDATLPEPLRLDHVLRSVGIKCFEDHPANGMKRSFSKISSMHLVDFLRDCCPTPSSGCDPNGQMYTSIASEVLFVNDTTGSNVYDFSPVLETTHRELSHTMTCEVSRAEIVRHGPSGVNATYTSESSVSVASFIASTVLRCVST